MTKNIELFPEGLEEYPRSAVLLENILIFLWIILGTFLISKISLFFRILYLSAAMIMILLVMRRLLCVNCYYYGKRCHVAWGKISSRLYKQGDLDDFKTCPGQTMAPIFFGLLALIPLVFGLIGLVTSFSLDRALFFSLLVLIILYSSIPVRKKGCEKCKMRKICPGSAAK